MGIAAADRQRVFIRRLIAEVRSKQQIKDALVAEYGRPVLATPQGSGFDLTACLIPHRRLPAGSRSLAAGVRRWRRRPDGSQPQPPTPNGEEAERLESDLARYDL